MSDTPISDSTPHNVADLGMLCRRLERELTAANSIIRQQQLLDEQNLRLQDRIKRLEEALTWYEYTVSNCYCHGSEGDAARDALRKDQGRKAKEAKL
jgi:hypothetical protein